MNTTTAATVPAVTSQIADLMDDLTGFHPALDRIVAAFGELLTADLDADQSQTAIAVLGGLADGHLATLLGLTLRKIASPDTNPALADLTDDRKQTLRRLGAEYAAAIADDYTTRVAAEASAAIDGS
jgi:hypothetical protein